MNVRTVYAQCAKCSAGSAEFRALKHGKLTFACMACGKVWAMRICRAPEDLRKAVQVILVNEFSSIASPSSAARAPER